MSAGFVPSWIRWFCCGIWRCCRQRNKTSTGNRLPGGCNRTAATSSAGVSAGIAYLAALAEITLRDDRRAISHYEFKWVNGSLGSRCFHRRQEHHHAAPPETGFTFMRTNIPEKLLKIVEEIDEHGNASLTRLTVLKKWLERPERLSAFAIWGRGARGFSQRQDYGAGRRIFPGRRGRCWQVWTKFGRDWTGRRHRRCMTACGIFKRISKPTVGSRAHRPQLEPHAGGAGSVNLPWHLDSSTHGYKLAADYCQHYDPRYGNGLNGSSRRRLRKSSDSCSPLKLWKMGRNESSYTARLSTSS